MLCLSRSSSGSFFFVPESLPLLIWGASVLLLLCSLSLSLSTSVSVSPLFISRRGSLRRSRHFISSFQAQTPSLCIRLSLHLSLSPFKLPFLCESTSVSVSASLKFLSAARINSLSSTPLPLSGQLRISTVSQRSTQYSGSFCVSHPFPPVTISPSLSFSRPSHRAPPSPAPPAAVGVTLQPAGFREQLTPRFLAPG